MATDGAGQRVWLLLRGLGRCSEHWGEFPRQLQQRFPADTVLALDLPGLGRRHRERSPSGIAQAVEAYRRQLREPGCDIGDTPLHLVGLSMGGMVALAWLQRHPREVARAFVINTSTGSLNPWYRRLRPVAAIRLTAAAFATAAQRERIVFDLTSQTRDRRAQVMAQWLAIARRYPLRRANLWRQITAALRFRAHAPPAGKVLLLASLNDRLADAECSLCMARRWQVPIRVHAAAGHDLPLDDPGWLLKVIGESLAGT